MKYFFEIQNISLGICNIFFEKWNIWQKEKQNVNLSSAKIFPLIQSISFFVISLISLKYLECTYYNWTSEIFGAGQNNKLLQMNHMETCNLHEGGKRRNRLTFNWKWFVKLQCLTKKADLRVFKYCVKISKAENYLNPKLMIMWDLHAFKYCADKRYQKYLMICQQYFFASWWYYWNTKTVLEKFWF